MAAHKDASVVEFENTLRRNPASLVFSRLADSYRKRGDIQQAIEVCSRGLADHPDSVTGRIILGRCFLEQEKLTEAMQEFVSVIEHDHRNQVALKMLADVYARQGMKDKAGDLYAYLCGFDPENETLSNLVQTYAGTGKINIFEILGFSSPPPAGTGSTSRPHAAADDIFDSRADGPGDSSPTINDAAFAQTMKFDTEELTPSASGASGADFARTIQYDALDLQPSGSAAYEVEEVVDDSAPGAAATVTGDDISKRMSMMFEDEAAPADSLSKTSEAESVPAELQPPEITDADSSDARIPSPEVFSGVSGADVSSRIDQLFSENRQPQSEQAAPDFTRLFDEPENSPVEAPSRGLDTEDKRLRQSSALGVSADETKVSGEDIVSRMNEMFETQHDAQAPQAAEIEAVEENLEFEDEEEVSDVAMSLAASLPDSVGQPEDVISGDDIALRLETIFDEEPVAMTQTAAPDERAEITGEAYADEPIVQAPTAPEELTGGNQPGARGDLDVSDALDTLGDPEDETFMAIDAGMAAAATVIEEQPFPTSDSSPSAASLASSVLDAGGAFADEPGELTDDQLHEATLELEDTAQIDDTPEMSGNDVLGRLDEMFPQSLLEDDGVTHVDEIPDNDKDDEPVNQGFYTMSGDNAETAKSEESLLEKLDDVEFEPPPESLVSSRNDIFAEAPDAHPGVEATEFTELESLRAVESFEPPRQETAVEPPADQDDDALPPLTVSAGDQRQAPDYSIPDHVLTPTLADIYFQQGQPHLAVEIYQRLLRKDPDNERIARRIADIERHIAVTGQQQLAGNEKTASNPAAAKAPIRAAKPPVVRKPLAGVRIKKSDKKKNKKR